MENMNTQSAKHPVFNLSLLSLVLANLLVIFFALKENWSLEFMIWVYFFQNIILGFFWPAKVLTCEYDGEYTKKILSLAAFMPEFYATHIGYAFILHMMFGDVFRDDFEIICLVAAIFFVSEVISFFTEERRKTPITFAEVHFFPFVRVIPMHATLLAGFALQQYNKECYSLEIFLVLKMLADIGMYLAARSRLFQKLVTLNVNYNAQYKKALRFTAKTHPMLNILPEPKPQKNICSFCQKPLSSKNPPRRINNRLYCQSCFMKIQKELQNSKKQSGKLIP